MRKYSTFIFILMIITAPASANLTFKFTDGLNQLSALRPIALSKTQNPANMQSDFIRQLSAAEFDLFFRNPYKTEKLTKNAIMVLDNRIPEQEKSQKFLGVCEISELTEAQRADAIKSLDLWRRSEGELLHEWQVDEIINYLKYGKKKYYEDSFSDLPRVYIAIDFNEPGPNIHINIEGFVIVKELDEETWVTGWEIHPKNKQNFPNPKYVGVGRQLLCYAVLREMKTRDSIGFDIGLDEILQNEGLRPFFVYTKKEVLEYVKSRLLKNITILLKDQKSRKILDFFKVNILVNTSALRAISLSNANKQRSFFDSVSAQLKEGATDNLIQQVMDAFVKRKGSVMDKYISVLAERNVLCLPVASCRDSYFNKERIFAYPIRMLEYDFAALLARRFFSDLEDVTAERIFRVAHEMAINVSIHGEGGFIIYKRGVDENGHHYAEIIGIDRGPGMRFMKLWTKRFMTSRMFFQVFGFPFRLTDKTKVRLIGQGFSMMVKYADEVTVESRGRKFQLKDKYYEKSKWNKGLRVTARIYFEPNKTNLATFKNMEKFISECA